MKSSKHDPAKVAYWSAHITKWKRSGLLQKEYCARQGLHVKSFGYWKRALGYGTSARAAKDDSGMPKQLIPVSILGDVPADALPVFLSRGQQKTPESACIFEAGTPSIWPSASMPPPCNNCWGPWGEHDRDRRPTGLARAWRYRHA